MIWVEEAESVSAASWNILIPTIRKDPCNLYETPHPSEIWITFNPKLDSDATYRMFVLNPPPPPSCIKIEPTENGFSVCSYFDPEKVDAKSYQMPEEEEMSFESGAKAEAYVIKMMRSHSNYESSDGDKSAA